MYIFIEYPLLIPISFFVLGIIIGSFSLCILDRTLSNNNIFSRSHCDKCKTTIPFYNLIPILSYLFLLGKCHFCKKKISPRYPIVELFFGFLFFLIWHKVGIKLEIIIYLICWSLLFIIVILDWSKQWFFTKLLFFCLVFSSFLLIFKINNLADSLLGLTIGAGSFYFIAFFYKLFTGKDGLGDGDISLLGLLGFFLGWSELLPIVLYSSIGGIILGLIFFAEKGRSKPFPFTPPLVIAAFINWLLPELYFVVIDFLIIK